MKTNQTFRFLILGVCSAAIAGCAHTVPAELASARDACRRTNAGLAPRLVPAELHQAEVVLAKAEKSFADEPESFVTRDLAYVAWRKCEMADALAGTASDQTATARSKDAYSNLQGKIMESAKSDLTKSEANLSATRSDLRQSRAALMEALAKLAAVTDEDRGMVITLSGSVLFRSNESTLLPGAMAKLDQVSDALLADRDRSLVVEGHTDSQGTNDANQTLSQQRADAVRSYLIGRGYGSALIVAHGMGEGRPIADNASPEGRSNNRRVEIIIQRNSQEQAAGR